MYILTKTTSFAVFFLLILTIPVYTFSQISTSGKPLSFQHNLNAAFDQETEEVIVPVLDREKALKEDEKNGAARFAAPVAVNYSLEENGTWTILPGGDRVWRLQLYAQDALGIFVYYDDFYMPVGGQFFMYDANGQQLKGAYTNRNNKQSGKFMTGMIEGETAILEYYEPLSARGQGIIDISRIYYAYKNDFKPQLPDNVYPVKSGFGDAADCHVNINCDEGANWQDHKRGVVRILRVFDEGMGWCSGSLINNTNQDETPYILSAFHCYDGFTPQLDVWRFDFNYESTACSNPLNEPGANSMLGCQYRAGWSDTDVLLLELLENVPSTYNARFNGWNRTLSHIPDTSTIIHHPRGDIKKISQDYDPAIIFGNSINWSNGVTTPPNHHYEVNFDLGTFEDGSSGSNLLDENGHIIGQLHGGNSSCFLFEGFFGRFSLSWDEGPTQAERLREWLDPAGTGQLILEALEPATGGMITIAGNIQARTGQNMEGLEVTITDDVNTWTATTDVNGNYSIELPEGPDYTVDVHKDVDPGNGVSTFDIVLTSRHILLIEEFDDPLKEIAADANNNGSVTSFDMVRMRRVILGLSDDFPESESWRFSPLSVTVNTSSTLDFIGIKIGDPSGNANPN